MQKFNFFAKLLFFLQLGVGKELLITCGPMRAKSSDRNFWLELNLGDRGGDEWLGRCDDEKVDTWRL